MTRTLSVALLTLAATGCLPDGLDDFCDQRAEVCYGEGKEPWGTNTTGTGGIGGSSGSNVGISIDSATLGANCADAQMLQLKNEFSRCNGAYGCNVSASSHYGGGDPVPNCSEHFTVRWFCNGGTQRQEKTTTNPSWESLYITCPRA